MKKTILTVLSTLVIILVSQNTTAGLQLEPSNRHLNIGFGLVTSDIPVMESDLRIILSALYYDFSFMAPSKMVRTSIEIGMYGYYGILPIPEIGANLYIGSEDRNIQAKIGVGGFYDIFVGGHGGMALKPGIIIKNRFDISFMIVPLGTDSKEPYPEILGFESSSDEYDDDGNVIKKDGPNVIMPYYGMMFTVRL